MEPITPKDATRVRPTPKQQQLAQNLVANQLKDKPLTLKEVLVKSGYSLSTAGASTRDIIEREGVQQALSELHATMADALAAKGINPDTVAEAIHKLLNAQKVRIIVRADGDEVIEEEKEDSFAINKGITHALKIGIGGGYKEAPPIPNVNILNIHGASELAREYEAKMLELLKQSMKPKPLPPDDDEAEQEVDDE